MVTGTVIVEWEDGTAGAIYIHKISTSDILSVLEVGSKIRYFWNIDSMLHIGVVQIITSSNQPEHIPCPQNQTAPVLIQQQSAYMTFHSLHSKYN